MALTTVPSSLSATALTLTTAAQPNITSVGTLSSLTVSGALNGTLSTAAQTNITSVGTLTGLTVTGNVTVNASGGRQYINTGHLRLSDNYKLEWGGGTNYIIGSNASNELKLATNSTAALTLDTSQNATFSGNITATGTVMVTDNASITNQTDMQLALRDSDNTNMRANFMVEKAANSNRGGLAIQATEAGVTDDRDIYIQPGGGRVGILTATPQYPLHISGNTYITSLLGVNKAVNAAVGLSVGSDASTTSSYGLEVCNSTSNTRFIVDGVGSSYFYKSDNALGMKFEASTGNVSIGSTHSGFTGWKVLNVRGESTGGMLNFENSSGTRSFTFANQGSGMRYQAHISGGYHRFETNAQSYAMFINNAGYVGVGGTASPMSRFQAGSHTFSGSNGMYQDSRVGMSNHGSLTGLMLASTYNDPNYPEYGLVFVQGPSTSSYNCWSISPDGPAKGNRLNFHYQAQASNIHTASRMASLDGSGNFYPVGDVVMAQGKGIQFVNQADFATGETVVSSILDDYEEGRFDPYIGGSSAVGTWTSNNANGGYYIKVGRMVQVWINCTGSLSGASGTMRVYGLPFVCASNIAAHAYNAVYSSGSLQYWSGSSADVMGPLTYPYTRYLYFHTYNGSSNGGSPSVNNSGHNLHCCAVYYTS